jgi:hypothetical protein
VFPERLAAAIEVNDHDVMVDLSDVTFMSHGVSPACESPSSLPRERTRSRLTRPSSPVIRLFAVAGLEKWFGLREPGHGGCECSQPAPACSETLIDSLIERSAHVAEPSIEPAGRGLPEDCSTAATIGSFAVINTENVTRSREPFYWAETGNVRAAVGRRRASSASYACW